MDSVSQLVLGASIAGACAPKGHKRKALLIGAGLGTLPDLDVIIDYGDPVSNFVLHRGFSHSLFVLVPFSLALWLVLHKWWQPVKESPGRWLAVIMLTLVTHALLDAHTVYGTQLLWPLETPPVMWSTLFIIDPLYTLPLVIGVIAAAFLKTDQRRQTFLATGLVVSTLYLGWSWTAKLNIEADAESALASLQLQDAPRFSVPTPFNTLLWRVVVKVPDGYLVGYRSIVADDEPMDFVPYESNDTAKIDASSLLAVQQLRWFSQDFLETSVELDQLIISDVRMGLEPDNYVFSFIAAEKNGESWKAIPPQTNPTPRDFGQLSSLWDRIWTPSTGGIM